MAVNVRRNVLYFSVVPLAESSLQSPHPVGYLSDLADISTFNTILLFLQRAKNFLSSPHYNNQSGRERVVYNLLHINKTDCA